MTSPYQEALQYLYANLPMFQRVGSIAYKKDLGNTLKLCTLLDNPHLKFKSIHVGGTNGKGSSSHMLASILQTAGYKTGLYTSPHLKEFTERIKINGLEVSTEFVVSFVNKIKPAIAEIKPSFFEITVAMAFDYFAQEAVDIAVVEVGLGGRLDSTNVITPVVSLITNISWDHKEILGDTLQAIAAEKAGIIKKNIPVVISERQDQIADVFINKAVEQHAEIFFASDEYAVDMDSRNGTINVLRMNKMLMNDIAFPLRGLYQKKNVAAVVKTIDVLQPHFRISKEQLKQGLENIVSLTNFRGRWQILGNNPTVICDTAHNASGVLEVVKQIASMYFQHLHIVWGMVKDKDAQEILALLPNDARYYFCEAKIPRALNVQLLKLEAEKYGLYGQAFTDVNAAKKAALANARKDDVVFIGGSTFVVAELEEI